MRCAAPVCLLLLAGCSTAPIADLLDFFRPGRLEVGKTAPYGGVCIPQGGPVATPAIVVPAPAPQPVVAAPLGAPQVPPPAPAPRGGAVPFAPPEPGGAGVPPTRPF